MKYNEKRNVITLTLEEFVTIARRGISSTLSYDEDEPSLCEMGKIRLKSIAGEGEPRILFHEFSDGGFSFQMSAVADKIENNTIVFARSIESNPNRPKKSEIEEIRGEGYILAYMLAKSEGFSSIKIRFIYYNRQRDTYKETVEVTDEKKLSDFFNKCLSKVRIFASPEIERVTKRLPSMKKLKFPYSNIREGQSEFIRTAYRTLSKGSVLYASAPTGTGKTISALYPAIRGLGDERFDKIFYLTPKTTTASAAKECLEIISQHGGLVRAIILTAKEKSCTKGQICKKSKKLCENSRNNNIASAALTLADLNLTVVTIEEVSAVAEKYSVCPYELSLAYSELCDVVICDFNYLFDPTVYIKRFFTKKGSFAFLIDEAHNLHERTREMYSAEITSEEISEPFYNELLGDFSATKNMSLKAESKFLDILFPCVKDEIRENKDGEKYGATNLSEVPTMLFSLIDDIMQGLEEEIFENSKANDVEKDARLAFLKSHYYKIKKFSDALLRFDSSYKLFVFYEKQKLIAKVYCLDTGQVIRDRLNLGHGSVLFSATLSPMNYYRSVLGGDRNDEVLEVNSPFDKSQLSVSIMDKISTRFSEREDTLFAVCRAVAAVVSAKRGNYMIFSPSFAYSEALAKAFSAKYPKLHIISQKKNMTVKEREDFLQEFKKEDSSYLVAFCIMGGIYSEGIDLAGDSLIGAIIVGIGMPALSYEREAIAEYYEEKYEEGKQYAYIYPGMNRVFQAAGRVIRREDDRGVIVLIDDRFDDPIYKKSLPKLWEGVKFIGDAKTLKEEIESFWKDKKQV